MAAVRRLGPLAAAALLTLGEPPRFTPVQPDLLGAGSTLVNAWADYDGDGDLDLFVGFNGTANRLYRNDNGTLLDVATALRLADARATRAGAWGDFDGDGDPDLVVGFAPGPQSVLRLYRNDIGQFTDVTPDAGVARDSGAVRQLSWVDYDADGDLDLFVAFRDRANALFRNDVGRFKDIAADVGLADRRKSVGAVWFDYDEDGDLDLYLANMDGDANALYRNDAGKFTDVAAERGVAWGGRAPNDSTNGTVRPCAADVDGDGHLDIITANYGKNGLFLNRGRGQFDDGSKTWWIDIDSRYDTCALDDFDNDGKLDLYVNGTVTGGTSYRDYLFRNTGQHFEDVTPDNIRALQADHGAAWADFDRDGDVDLALTGSRPDGMHLVMRNELEPGAARRSLSISVVDSRGRALLAGAEVRVYAAGTHRLIGTRLVDTGSGYDAQSVTPVHFGLPTSAAVDVEVTFPHAGKRQVTHVPGVDPRRVRSRALVVKVTANQ
jgi:VCBS repeat protein/ASPIC/UnbV protein